MKLFEFDSAFVNDDSLIVKTSAVLADITSGVEDSAFEGTYKLDALAHELNKNGIRVSPEQIRDSVSQGDEPWVNFISNVQGNDVVFLGTEDQDSEAMAPDDTSATLDDMAKRAASKPGL